MLVITALAFDFDGTLVDISEPYSKAFNETLRNFELPGSNPIELYRKGASDLKTQFSQAISRADVDLVQKCVKMHGEIYTRIHLKHLKKSDKALNTLKELDFRGYRLALIGGRPLSQVEPELKFLGMKDCFDFVLTSEAVSRPKPAPDIVQRAAELWNIATKQILVVGDSPDDIASAKSAGAFSAGTCDGYFSRKLVAMAKPDFLLNSVSEILDVVARRPGKS